MSNIITQKKEVISPDSLGEYPSQPDAGEVKRQKAEGKRQKLFLHSAFLLLPSEKRRNWRGVACDSHRQATPPILEFSLCRGSVDKFDLAGLTLHKLFSQSPVRGRAYPVWFILDDRFAEARRFPEPD